MRFGLLLLLLGFLASCSDTVLDPNDLPGDGDGTGAGKDVLYFVTFNQNASDVCIESMKTDGSNRKQLLGSAYFTSAPAKGKFSIMTPQGVEVCTISDTNNRILLAGSDMYLSATLSPTGDNIVYAIPTGDILNPTVALMLVPTTGGGVMQVIDTSADPFIAPAFSPDGTQLAFVKKASDVPFSNDSLIVVSLNSYSRSRLYAYQFSGLRTDIELDWTPDGRRLLVLDDNYGGGVSIKLISVTGGAEQEIVAANQTLFYSYPALSPDGSLLAVSRLDYRTNEFSLVIYNLQGQEIAATPSTPENIVMPCFSPDGKKVVYSVMDGAFNIVEFTANTTQMNSAKIKCFTIATQTDATLASGNVLRPVFER